MRVSEFTLGEVASHLPEPYATIVKRARIRMLIEEEFTPGAYRLPKTGQILDQPNEVQIV